MQYQQSQQKPATDRIVQRKGKSSPAVPVFQKKDQESGMVENIQHPVIQPKRFADSENLLFSVK
jgi:hypothetical protein